MQRIDIRALTKTYTVDGAPVPVLRGLDLTLEPADITVIVGKSGCGKTTLLRILSGLETAGGGTLSQEMRADTSIVFQEPRLMPWLDVTRNIGFGQTRPDAVRIHALIEMVGLARFAHAYPNQLSGGMQQRVSLARALAQDTKWILMDEPFAALDAFTREGMQQELLRIQKKRRKGVVFVTHSMDEALVLGKKIVLLKNGVADKVYDLSGISYPRDLLSEALIALKRDLLARFT